MELRFECPRCDSLHQVARPLDALREHIARVHLDLAVFCCPRCKLTFINAFNAHHHIRKECHVLGVLEVKDYTRSLLGMDSTYLAELQALENEAIFNLFQRRMQPPSPPHPSRSESVEYLGTMPADPNTAAKPSPFDYVNYSPGKEATPIYDLEPLLEIRNEDVPQKRPTFTMAENAKRRKMTDEESCSTGAEEEEDRSQPPATLASVMLSTIRDPPKPTPICKYSNFCPGGCQHGSPHRQGATQSSGMTNVHQPLPFLGLAGSNTVAGQQRMSRPRVAREIECVCTSPEPMPNGYRQLLEIGCNYDCLQENVTEICVFKNRTLARGHWIEVRFSRISKMGLLYYWHNGKERSDLRYLHPNCKWKGVGIKEQARPEEEHKAPVAFAKLGTQ